MKKDAYYFPHFSNARNDAKLVRLRRIYGIEGYGIFFMLLEVLREQTEFKLPLNSIEDLAYEWHVSKEKILSIVNDFDLFEITDNKFFSPKLVLYLQPYIEKSNRARKAALKRWDNANALPEHNKSNASKVKKSKVKESKLKKSIENKPINFSDLENTQWFESILRYLKNKISLNELKDYWQDYQNAMIADGDLYRDATEYRAHFRNWVKKQIESKKETSGIVKKEHINMFGNKPVGVLKNFNAFKDFED